MNNGFMKLENEIKFSFNEIVVLNKTDKRIFFAQKINNLIALSPLEIFNLLLYKKDIQGNDLFRYDFMYGETLCSLVPINTIYPLAYVLMRKQGKEFYEGINNNKYAYIAIGNGMIASVKFRELESGIGSDDKYKRITCQDDRVDVDLKDQKGYIQSGTFIKGKGSGKPFSNAREFFEAESLKFELGTSTSIIS